MLSDLPSTVLLPLFGRFLSPFASRHSPLSLSPALPTPLPLCLSPPLQEMFELFETSLNELRIAKLAVHQTFFRAMESFESKSHDSMLVVTEAIMKQVAEDPTSFDHLTDDVSVVRSTTACVCVRVRGC